jgi:hypothetical protein
VATGRFDEVFISTLPRGVSKWLRRDLVGRVRRLGLPVTAIVPGDRPRRSLHDVAMDSLDLGRQAFHTASRGSGVESDHRREGQSRAERRARPEFRVRAPLAGRGGRVLSAGGAVWSRSSHRAP